MRVDGEILGLAFDLEGVAESLRRAGLEIAPDEVARVAWIEWRGGGPDHWGPAARS